MEKTATLPAPKRVRRSRKLAGISAAPFCRRCSACCPADRHLGAGGDQVGNIPGPDKTWDAALVLFADPFYRNGPNDQGIGWNVLSSLQARRHRLRLRGADRHSAGLHARSLRLHVRMFDPIISLLRPVSPLAWLPIGLLVFQKADPAATWTIFICSIWPMILNTAQGVQRVPQDYLNVARVLACPSGRSSPRSSFRPCCPTC
jgi:nitrate/nitrite transport system permease protein